MPAPITLRVRHGSRPRVEKVYCWDQSSDQVHVLCVDAEGERYPMQLDADDLEAANDRGGLLDVRAVLTSKAADITNRKE